MPIYKWSSLMIAVMLLFRSMQRRGEYVGQKKFLERR